jgi:ketosteroid isomerase-like protein
MRAIAGRLITRCGIALLAGVAPLSAAPASDELVAERAIAARQRMMQDTATPADVDAFLAFATDDVVYEDPVVGIRIAGKELLRKGMSGFLGATRNPRIVIGKRIAAANVVVFEQKVSFDAKQDDGSWKSQTRTQVTVFEFEGDRIRRIADYWPR